MRKTKEQKQKNNTFDLILLESENKNLKTEKQINDLYSDYI